MNSASYEDFKSSNADKMDEGLLVKFFYKEREDKAKTLEEGRPCFKEVEYVEIRIPGNRDPQACRPATLHDKARFERHYDAFKRRVEVPEEGTLLKEWPQISRSQIEEMSFLNVKTVEQLAGMSDGNAGKLHGGITLKRRATEWLSSAGETQLIAEKEALQARLTDMESKLAQMQEHMAQVAHPAPSAIAPPVPAPMPAPTALDAPAQAEETKPRRPRRKPAEK